MDKIMYKMVSIFLDIVHIKATQITVDSIVQFIKFAIVGITNTVIYCCTNILTLFLIRPLELDKDYIVGNIVGFIISVLWSFYWNNRFVFKENEGENRNYLTALLKVFISYGFTGIILSNAISYLLIDLCNISKYIVPLINSIIGVPVNFILNKLWAFKGQK